MIVYEAMHIFHIVYDICVFSMCIISETPTEGSRRKKQKVEPPPAPEPVSLRITRVKVFQILLKNPICFSSIVILIL